MVRANYNDYKNNIYSTFEYLNHFFGNLLLGESALLKNRDLRVGTENKENVPVNVPVKPANVPVKRKDEILKQLLLNPHLTIEELSAFFTVAEKTIKRDIAVLKNEGKIKRVGSDKTGHWEVL